MRACEGRIGRVFVMRLEDGDVVPQCIEEYAERQGVRTGMVILVGGLSGGEVVVGPRKTDEMPPNPMFLPLDGAHEVAAVGVLAPGKDGRASLHIHGAMGRSGQTITGCLRRGVTTWVVGEAILHEILGTEAQRVPDTQTGFALLEPRGVA
jgi:uncharacterized protein